MIKFSFKTIDVDGFKDDLVAFHSKNPRAIAIAMNKSASKAQTRALKQVNNTAVNGRAWNIGTRDLKKYVKKTTANSGSPTTVFEFNSHSTSLLDFTRTKDKRSQNKVGVRYKVKKLGGTKVKEHAFINESTKRRGTNFVLLRDSKPRYPITPQIVVSPSYMFVESKGSEAYVRTYLANFNRNYSASLKYLLKL